MKHDSLRKYGPEISSIKDVPLPKANLFTLDNGIELYYINEGSQELTKLDVVFEGGRHRESQKTLARSFGSLVKEGTKNHSSEEISAYFDYHGASYNVNSSLDFTTFTLFSLSRFFSDLLPRFSDIIFCPNFPDSELEKYRKNSLEKLLMDKSKNDVMAYRYLTANLFGEGSLYGYNSSIESFQALTRTALLDFHHDMLNHQKCALFLSGRYNLDVLETINTIFGQWNYTTPQPLSYNNPKIEPYVATYDAPNKLQSALRFGQHFGNKNHPDYGNLSFLNNVFGGFFGSRLMKNIREDKGFTYNIYSDIDTMLMDGYFYIASELDGEYVNAALDEIYAEMEILKSEFVDEEELEMNKNYILGNLLNSVDGPFQEIRMVKSAVLNYQDMSDVKKIVDTFLNMTPEIIQETAKKYLNPDSFFQVRVG